MRQKCCIFSAKLSTSRESFIEKLRGTLAKKNKKRKNSDSDEEKWGLMKSPIKISSSTGTSVTEIEAKGGYLKMASAILPKHCTMGNSLSSTGKSSSSLKIISIYLWKFSLRCLNGY